MSIKVFKRTREEVTPATVPATYTEWSEWIETTDVPPYTNTLLMEYSIGGIEDTSDLKNLFQMFSTELKTTIQDVQSISHLEQEHFATIVSEGIVGAMNSSVNALRVLKANKEMILNNELDRVLKDAQIETEKKRALDIASQTAVRDAQSEKDLLLKDAQIETENKNQAIKDQQELAEKIKNGGIHYNYTYYVEGDAEVTAGTKEIGDIKSKTIATGDAKSIYEIDKETKIAQIGYTKAQEDALYQQLEDNRKIKVMNNVSSTYGTMGAGGLTVSSEAWTFYFQIAKNLIEGTSTISIPTSTVITKVA